MKVNIIQYQSDGSTAATVKLEDLIAAMESDDFAAVDDLLEETNNLDFASSFVSELNENLAANLKKINAGKVVWLDDDESMYAIGLVKNKKPAMKKDLKTEYWRRVGEAND